jgi:Ran GTPase-activating protein (RanGAP) involved in mRNA processing and transport
MSLQTVQSGGGGGRYDSETETLQLTCVPLSESVVELVAAHLSASQHDQRVRHAQLASCGLTQRCFGALCERLLAPAAAALQSVELDDNDLIGDDVRLLVAMLLASPTLALSRLSLEHTGLSRVSVGAVQQLLTAPQCALRELNCSNNELDDAGLAELAPALAANTSLVGLWLCDNELTDVAARRIASALESNTTLLSIYMHDNMIGDRGAAALAAALEHERARLQLLDLGVNELSAHGVAALAAMLERNTSLRALMLEANEFGAQGTCMLARALSQNRTLEALSLGNNAVGDEGAAALGAMLQQNCTLRGLDLRGCGVEGDGLVALADALRVNRGLAALNLDDNELPDDAVAHFFAAIGSSDDVRLTKLGMCECGLSDEVALQIAQCIARNRSLAILRLDDNLLTSDAVCVIAEALKTNTTLVELSLSGNDVSADAGLAIIDMLRLNITLLSLTIDHAVFSAHDAVMIEALLKRNDAIAPHKVAPILLDVALALAPLKLPTYVLLEIVDWFPFFVALSRSWKISRLERVRDSVKRVRGNRYFE